MTVEEVMEKLGLCKVTVENLLKEGSLKSFSRVDVEEWKKKLDEARKAKVKMYEDYDDDWFL